MPCDIIKEQIDGNEGSRLRCYSDEQIGNYSNHFEKPCDYLTSINLIDVRGINVYPVPCSDFLIIEINQTKGEFLQIKDITGKIFITQRMNNNKCRVNLSAIQKGILFLEVMTSEGKFCKIIIKT